MHSLATYTPWGMHVLSLLSWQLKGTVYMEDFTVVEYGDLGRYLHVLHSLYKVVYYITTGFWIPPDL